MQELLTHGFQQDQARLQRAPSVLLVSPQWAGANVSLQQTVAVPIEGGARAEYTLRAVVVRIGVNADAGHYIAHVRQAADSWCSYDDERVSDADEHEVFGGLGVYLVVCEHNL